MSTPVAYNLAAPNAPVKAAQQDVKKDAGNKDDNAFLFSQIQELEKQIDQDRQQLKVNNQELSQLRQSQQFAMLSGRPEDAGKIERLMNDTELNINLTLFSLGNKEDFYQSKIYQAMSYSLA